MRRADIVSASGGEQGAPARPVCLAPAHARAMPVAARSRAAGALSGSARLMSMGRTGAGRTEGASAAQLPAARRKWIARVLPPRGRAPAQHANGRDDGAAGRHEARALMPRARDMPFGALPVWRKDDIRPQQGEAPQDGQADTVGGRCARPGRGHETDTGPAYGPALPLFRRGEALRRRIPGHTDSRTYAAAQPKAAGGSGCPWA